MSRVKGKFVDYSMAYASHLKRGGVVQKVGDVELFYEQGAYRIKYPARHHVQVLDQFWPATVVVDMGNDYYLAQRVFKAKTSR